MLPVYLEVPREAKKIINKNVGYMFELLKCTCEGLSYADVLDSIYPSYILDIKLEKCVQTIKELYNMTQDNYELESFLYIDVENYLELMPNDTVKEYQAMKERRNKK